MNKIFLENLKITNTIEDDQFLTIEGYACHWDKANLNSERVDANSFNTFFNMYNNREITPIVNYNHDINQIIGGINTLKVDDTGLFLEASLNKNVKIVRDMIAPNVLSGVLTGLSTEGYILNGWKGVEEFDDGTYYVKDYILSAVAVTNIPADTNARFTLRNAIQNLKSQVEPKNLPWYYLL